MCTTAGSSQTLQCWSWLTLAIHGMAGWRLQATWLTLHQGSTLSSCFAMGHSVTSYKMSSCLSRMSVRVPYSAPLDCLGGFVTGPCGAMHLCRWFLDSFPCPALSRVTGGRLLARSRKEDLLYRLVLTLVTICYMVCRGFPSWTRSRRYRPYLF